MVGLRSFQQRMNDPAPGWGQQDQVMFWLVSSAGFWRAGIHQSQLQRPVRGYIRNALANSALA